MQKADSTKLVKDLLLSALLIFGIGWLIFTYHVLLGPLIIACLIAYLLYPGVTWISNRIRINRQYTVIIVYLSFLAALIMVVAFVAPVIISQFFLLAELLVRLPDLIEITQNNLEESFGFQYSDRSIFC